MQPLENYHPSPIDSPVSNQSPNYKTRVSDSHTPISPHYSSQNNSPSPSYRSSERNS